jgi:hypothetical protein
VDQKERLATYELTEKQRNFEWDFFKGFEAYEFWEDVRIGDSAEAEARFEVKAEDIVSFNKSCFETDPAMLDPVDPVPHPLFAVQVTFFCIGTGIGSWIRTPGARNPGQTLKFFEDFRPGETITTTITHEDKWIRRGHFYMQSRADLRNEKGVLKATWHVRLLLPRTREAVKRFVEA